MGVVETLTERNAQFAESRFDAGLKIKPKLATIVIGCVDNRVDPAVVLGAEQGEIMAIRNIGGRVTPHVIEELLMLLPIGNNDTYAGWELILMQHTQCGITRIKDRPDLLAPFFQVPEDQVSQFSVGDPRAAVAHDVATLCGDERLAKGRISGLVYDVATGRVEYVVNP